jgi:aminoglycoside phosphotransferase family enzyme
MAAIPLETKLALLQCPETYPERPGKIEVIETHMSWVFLTDRYAFKMKKPVLYDFLDFSTLALRQFHCKEEVRLNRRLAADVYFGTIPLTIDSHDRVQIDGKGEVVEWLVKMRRLPRERMLDYMIRQGTVQDTDIDKLGQILARFYPACPVAEYSCDQYRGKIERTMQLNLGVLLTTKYELPTAIVRALHDAQAKFLEQESGLFDMRVESGKIVEGHGDLRPEHVCLEPAPVIIDCLEFNRDFRLIDPADELSFIAIECELLGAPSVGEKILRIYQETTGDRPPARLLTFYKIYRACLRARLAIAHLEGLEKQYWSKWQSSAMGYLHLAESYRAQLFE